MERKNINRGFKQLRVWNNSVELYILTCYLKVKKKANDKLNIEHRLPSVRSPRPGGAKLTNNNFRS